MLAAFLIGCGSGSPPDPVAVRSGGERIWRSTVAHWEHAIAMARPAGAHTTSRAGSRSGAVDYLISSSWLKQEAARRGITTTAAAIRHTVEERYGPISPAMKRDLAAKGRTVADAQFEAKVALLAAKLSATALAHEGAVTTAEIERYYERNRKLFRTESRVVDLIESSRTRSDAIALARRLGAGRSFSARALHETLKPMTPGQEAENFDGGLVHAVFAATPGVVAGPVPYVGKWVIFVVRQVLPEPRPFGEVSGEIARRLKKGRPRQALQTFIRTYRDRWRARTRCTQGFVAPDCSESPTQQQPGLSLIDG